MECGILRILLKPTYNFLMIFGLVLKGFSAWKVFWIPEEKLEGTSDSSIG